MKPYSPPKSPLEPRGTAKRFSYRADRAALEELLFAVRPMKAGRFEYEGVGRAFAALLRPPRAMGLDIVQCLSRDDWDSICEVLRTCMEQEAEVRVRHSLALGGLRRGVETIVFPVLDSRTGVVVRLIGRHRMTAPEKSDDDEPGTPIPVHPDLASIQENIEQRIASELHDSTCQHLIAASLGLARLRNCPGAADSARNLCDDVDASIDRALREIRALTYLLHPQDVMAEGLKATVECYVHGFAARTALRVRIGVDPGVDRLSLEGQRSLLRIVQEGLTNIFRHARATEVEILVQAIGGNFRLTISDNGRGFPSRHLKRGGGAISMGVGIPAMRERLARLGGSLEIRSSPAIAGTILCAVFPLLHAAKRRERRVPFAS